MVLWPFPGLSGFKHAERDPLGRAESYGVANRHQLILEHQEQQQQRQHLTVFGAAPAEHKRNCRGDNDV